MEVPALSKVFDHDTFIKGMGHARVLGDHVEMEGAVLRASPTSGDCHVSSEVKTR
jgi:hypothetical protein